MTNELIKRFEGFRSEPYLCSAKVRTIGYGTTEYPDWYNFPGKDPDGKVLMTDPPIDENLASNFVEEYVKKEINPMMRRITTPLNGNQKDAIKSLTYNLGATNIGKSTLLKKLNLDDFNGAAKEFMSWVYVARKINKGLLIRRTQELILFMTPAYKSDAGKKEIVAKGNILVVVLRWLIGLFKNQRS